MKKVVVLMIMIALMIATINFFSYDYIKSNLESINKRYAEGKIFFEKDFGLVKTKVKQLKAVFDSYKLILFNREKEELLFDIKIKTIELSEKLVEAITIEARIDPFRIDCFSNETKKLGASYELLITKIEGLKEKITVFLESINNNNEEMQKELDALEGLLNDFNSKRNYLAKNC